MQNSSAHTQYLEALQTLQTVDARGRQALASLDGETRSTTKAEVAAFKAVGDEFTTLRRSLQQVDLAMNSVYAALGGRRESSGTPGNQYSDLAEILRLTRDTEQWCKTTLPHVESLRRTMTRLERAALVPTAPSRPEFIAAPRPPAPVPTPTGVSPLVVIAVVAAAVLIVVLVILVVAL